MSVVTIRSPGGSVVVTETSQRVEVSYDDNTGASVESQDWTVSARERSWRIEAFSAVHVGGRGYDGGYSVIPSREHQTIRTAGCTLAEDITVEAIPSNYGLVIWDGSVLTVS